MLPLFNRLRGKRNFARVLEFGKMLQTPFFSLIYKEETGSPCFGFTVSNKISKRAHERNRARRLLREASRRFLPRMKEGFWFVVLAKKRILTANINEIAEQLGNVLRRSGALKEINNR